MAIEIGCCKMLLLLQLGCCKEAPVVMALGCCKEAPVVTCWMLLGREACSWSWNRAGAMKMEYCQKDT